MKQIANRAGVSISTVSLVLNNRDIGRVSPDVAERVRAIAAELGYLTNRLASGLRTSSSRTIGFLSDEVATTPFAGRMIEGAQDAARTLGYLLLTVGINSGAKSSDREILTLRQFGVDGFIYARMFNQKTMLPQSLQGCKVVLADSTDAAEVAPSIVPDEHSIGFKATSHLIDAGCTRIAYVGTMHNMVAQPGRVSGYIDALAEHGISFDPELMINMDTGSDAARPHARVLRQTPGCRRLLLLQRHPRLGHLHRGHPSRADYRQRYRGGWRRQPPGCGRSAGSAAFHCGTAALRDGLLGSR